jgi:uncharacterized protein
MALRTLYTCNGAQRSLAGLTLWQATPIQARRKALRRQDVVMSAHAPIGGAHYVPASQPWTVEGGAVRLRGSRCMACGSMAFPPHLRCAACGAESGQETVALSPIGTLYTFSEIHVAPAGFAVPYVVGYVDLPEGVRLFGQIEAHPSELTIGQRLAVTLGPVRTREGRAVIGYKFKDIPP